ncbi:MAG: lytic transglycosylase domain-containing protein [Clostridia bacterium]|nr:lytic transglycosylase domain-containing protein [Clostridia bacterium]
MNRKKQMIVILLIVVFIVIVFLFQKQWLKKFYPRTYQEEVTSCETKYKVDSNLIFAVIKAESNFDQNAVSNREAVGLMQIMEETAIDVARKNAIELDTENVRQELCKIDKNIEIGTCYLATLLQRYESKEVALAAYNAGIGTVDGWIEKGMIKKDGSDIENIPYKETNNYVRKILRDYKIYEDLYKMEIKD